MDVGDGGTLNSCLLRFQEKGNLEVLLFSIQSKLRAHNRRLFVPREGCGIWDIDKVSEAGDRGETRWHYGIVQVPVIEARTECLFW
jgi:hypothetical protein